MNKPKFIFDVKSTSLHGIGFAFGVMVIAQNGDILDKMALVAAEGEKQVNDWVKDNVIPKLEGVERVDTLVELRNKFYEFYMKWKDSCEIWSDVNFPVKTNFLTAVVWDDFKERESNMPFPLMDISTLVPIDINRSLFLNESKRKLVHNPLVDVEASYLALKNYYHELKA